jgi:hypothetical protein
VKLIVAVLRVREKRKLAVHDPSFQRFPLIDSSKTPSRWPHCTASLRVIINLAALIYQKHGPRVLAWAEPQGNRSTV